MLFTYFHKTFSEHVSWVRVPPRAAPFSFEKEVVLVGLAPLKIPFNLELGVFGGLITPVCSYILSEGFSVLSMA